METFRKQTALIHSETKEQIWMHGLLPLPKSICMHNILERKHIVVCESRAGQNS